MNELQRKHRELRVWQEAVKFCSRVYQLTEKFPRAEQFGLTSQLRRAAVSIPANLAEGAARKSSKELAQFVVIARGSAAEIDTLLEIARHVNLLAADNDLQQDLDHLTILIIRFEAAIRRRTKS